MRLPDAVTARKCFTMRLPDAVMAIKFQIKFYRSTSKYFSFKKVSQITSTISFTSSGVLTFLDLSTRYNNYFYTCLYYRFYRSVQ